MKKPETQDNLQLRPREIETLSLAVPKVTLIALKKIAARRDMSYQALLKLYIGQELRQDIAQFFGD